MDGFVEGVNQIETYKDATKICDVQQITIGKEYMTNQAREHFVHVPKTLAGTKGNVCFIDVHGGGSIGGSAKFNTNFASYFAVTLNCVVINVSYRLCFEGSGEECANDVLSVVRYARANCEQLGINKDKIVLHGNSAGGHNILGACAQMALNKESGLVRLVIPSCFQDCGWYAKTAKSDMPTKPMQNSKGMVNYVAACYALHDEAKMKDCADPFVYPTVVSDELLKRYPNIVTIYAEHCFFRDGDMVFTERLRKCGRLVDCVGYAGADHSFFMYEYKLSQQFWKDLKCIIDTYVRC